jgi:NAD(P)-dependent dehydrogenase (short-subunit alcohol dehydrogenase family)
MPKTVIITGCSTGLGRTSAIDFARKGWNVVATLRELDSATDFPRLDNVFVTRLDVQDVVSIRTALSAGISRFGSIDVLVNNAGFGLFGVFESTPVEKVREQFDVNVFGVMDTTRAILPHFRERKEGLILNVSSGAGIFTLPMLSLYCSSKFALEGFSESLSYELASQNIGVKIIEPGGVVSTDFGKRSGQEAAQNHPPPSYSTFVTCTNDLFQNLRSTRTATEQDVADVIYTAATDGSNRLRYVATEDIRPLVRYRRGTSEEEYIAFMRSQFGVSRDRRTPE